MDASYIIRGIFFIYTVFAGMALTVYFLSLCREEWEKRREARKLKKLDKAGKVVQIPFCGFNKTLKSGYRNPTGFYRRHAVQDGGLR